MTSTQGLKRLSEKFSRLSGSERPLRDQTVKGRSLHILHLDSDAVLIIADAVHADDTVVLDSSRGPCLPKQAVLMRRVRHQMRVKQLQRHAPLEASVIRLIHHPHPTGPQQSDD